ncbi:MAG: TAXI family TRAP transporter solute-binding subunit [Puniceicoccaceae bacterium]
MHFGKIFCLLVVFLAPLGVAGRDTFITIGTGGVTGVYYPLGGSISRLLNQYREEAGIRSNVESTGGSVYNINTLRQGELDFGIAQSDVQYQAYNGTGGFSSIGPYVGLRSVFSVHAEPFTVVAARRSGIETLADLKGKRVNIGNPGSGQRAMMERIMALYGWTRDDFALVSELGSAEQAKALSDGKVDAIVFTVGHPNGSIQECTTLTDAVLIEVQGPEIEQLIAENPYYALAEIPGGLYRGNPDPVTTFGVRATLVTDAVQSEKTVYWVTRAVMENFETFIRLHPAFQTIKREEMASAALSAPLHPGAEKYFREIGLLSQ